MIIGTGTDIVQIPRIEKLMEQFGEKFAARWFTDEEQQAASRYGADNKQAIAAHYAKRFAAKEACAKALGTGFRNGINFTDISVSNDEHGKPSLTLSGKALEHLQSLGKNITLHLSLSDDYPTAIAMVIAEERA